MDQPQYTKAMALIADLPDPRKPRGKQLEWSFIWGVILTAMLSQYRTPTAIAQWAQHQAQTLLAAFRPARQRVPSESPGGGSTKPGRTNHFARFPPDPRYVIPFAFTGWYCSQYNNATP